MSAHCIEERNPALDVDSKMSDVRRHVAGLRRDLWSEYTVTVLRAFVDDSGSDGNSPWVVLAGYVASVEAWDAFDGEWREALAKDKNVDCFHASEAESLKLGFLGFSKGERDSKIDALIEVIQRYAKQAICVRVRQKITTKS